MTAPRQSPGGGLEHYLAYQHQQEQEEVASQTALGLGVLWLALQFSRLDETQDAWLHGATLEIEKGWRRSVDTAAEFVQHTLWATEPTAGLIPRFDPQFPVQAIQASMRAAGPGTIRAKSRLAPEFAELIERDVMSTAKLGTTGAGVRHVLNGGREAVVQATQLADLTPDKDNRRVIGYARYTESGNGKNSPCYFCAMLASLGAVFAENAFLVSSKKFEGDNVDAVHDHCQCSLRPVFRRDDSRDERSLLFLDQWEKLTEGKSNYRPRSPSGRLGASEAMKAFRRGYAPPPPYKNAPGVDLEAVKRNRDRLLRSGFEVASPQVVFYDKTIQELAISQAA